MCIRRIIVLISVTLIFVSLFLIAICLRNEGFDRINPLDSGTIYRILETELVPRSDATSILTTDSALILYYDEYGLLNHYSFDGVFLYGIQIELLRNGSGKVVYSNPYLYVKSRGSRMYCFYGQDLVNSFMRSENPSEFKRIEHLLENGGGAPSGDVSYYYLPSTNTVASRAKDGPYEDIISLPQKNPNISTLCYLVLCLSFILCCNNPIFRRINTYPLIE